MGLARFPSDFEFVATYVQRVEIMQTKDEARRWRLLTMLNNVAPSDVPAETGFWNDGGMWGEAKWSNGPRFDAILAALDAKEKKPNNRQDAQIGETAMANDYGLITADWNLADDRTKFGVHVWLVGA